MHAGAYVASDHEARVIPFRGRQPRRRWRSPKDDLIDKKEVAKRLGRSIRWIEKQMYAADDPMPFDKPQPNGSVRFHWPSVEAWWAAKCAPPDER